MVRPRANQGGPIRQRPSDTRRVDATGTGRGPDGRPLRGYVTDTPRGKVRPTPKASPRPIDGGPRSGEESVTLSVLFQRWCEDVMRHQVEASTLRNYESIARNHILPTLGHLRLDDIRVSDVDHLLSLKRDAGLAPSTLRRIRIVLAQCLTQAIRWGLVQRNVATLSRPPKSQRSEGRTLTPDQARRFLEALRGSRHEALFALMLSTGLRRGEALGLWWSDFDRDAGVIRVARQLKREGRALLTSDTKTFRSRRAVNLPEGTVRLLLAHEEAQRALRERRGARWVKTDFIFTTSKGTPIDPRNFYRSFRAICDAAGLGQWHPHELRHSAASLMLAQGVKLHVVSQVLGHSSIRMTSDVYGHLLEPDRRGAALAMDSLLWGDGPRSADAP